MGNQVILFKQADASCRPCAILSTILKEDLGVQADKTVNLTTMAVYDKDGAETVGESAMVLAQTFGIMTTPVTILVDEFGNVIECLRGLPQRDKLIEVFNKRG